MQLQLRSTAADGRVPIRARVDARVAEALHDEASHRRLSPSRLLEAVLRDRLPELAEERVRHHVSTTLTKDDPRPEPGVVGELSLIAERDRTARRPPEGAGGAAD